MTTVRPDRRTKQTLEMPVVRNGETGLELLANNAEHFIRRAVAEEDFAGGADAEASVVLLIFIAVCAVPSSTLWSLLLLFRCFMLGSEEPAKKPFCDTRMCKWCGVVYHSPWCRFLANWYCGPRFGIRLFFFQRDVFFFSFFEACSCDDGLDSWEMS